MSKTPRSLNAWVNQGGQFVDWLDSTLVLLADRRRLGWPTHGEGTALSQEGWIALRSDCERELNLPSVDGANPMPPTNAILDEIKLEVATFPSDGSSEVLVSAILSLLHPPKAGRQKHSVEPFWPQSVLHLMCKLIGDDFDKPVYCPFRSSGISLPLSLAAVGFSVCCESPDARAIRILLLCAYICNVPVKARLNDPVGAPAWLFGKTLKKFRHSVGMVGCGDAFPDDPLSDEFDRFPHEFHYEEAYQWAHAVAQTSGIAVAFVPDIILGRMAGAERDYRRTLIEQGGVRAVISVPKLNASIGGEKRSVVVVDTSLAYVDGILFYDAAKRFSVCESDMQRSSVVNAIVHEVTTRTNSEFSRLVPYQEIEDQNFNLTTDRYLNNSPFLSDASEMEELDELADVIKPQSTPSSDRDDAHYVREVVLQDVHNGTIREPDKRLRLAEHVLSKAQRQRIQYNDILLSVRGRIGVVGIAPLALVYHKEPWIASQAFVILRVKKKGRINAVSLYRYLSSPLGQKVVASLAAGGNVPNLSITDLRKIKIMMPTAEQLVMIEEKHAAILATREEIAKLENVIESLNQTSWPMSRN